MGLNALWRPLGLLLVAGLILLAAQGVLHATAAQCRGLVLVVDTSSSITAKGVALEEALLAKLKALVPGNAPVAVIVFDSSVHYTGYGSSAKAVLAGALSRVSVGSGTNLYAALEAAKKAVESMACGETLVVLVTDGYPTVGIVDENSILALAKEIEGSGAEIIAFTPSGEHSSLLEKITGGKVYSLSDDTAKQLASQVGGLSEPDSDGDGIPDQVEESLAYTFLPVLVFDNDETMYPSPIDYYFKDIGLYRGEGDQLLATTITPEYLRQAAPAPWIDSSDTYNYYIDKFNDHKASEEEIEHDWPHTAYRHNYTVYYEVKPIGDNRIMLSYWFFYPLNNAPWSFAWGPINLNLHEGDWEHLAIVLEKNGDTYTPVTVYYCPHEWVEKYSYSEVEKFGTHLLLAIGRGSHAGYRITQVPFFEDNSLSGIVLVPPGIDVDALLQVLRGYGANPSGVEEWKTLINLGEPTNYTKAYEAIIGEEPPIRLDYTTPASSYTLFVDSKANWGVWAPPLSFAASGAPQPAMHKDFYDPEKKTVIPLSQILSFYEGDYTLIAMLSSYDYSWAGILSSIRGGTPIPGLHLPS